MKSRPRPASVPAQCATLVVAVAADQADQGTAAGKITPVRKRAEKQTLF